MTTLSKIAALALMSAAVAVPALAEQQEFKLINKSGYALVRFYASPTNTDNWGRDLFGDRVLETGYSSYVTVPNSQQCVFDFRMIFSDEDVLYDTINLCETGSYTIN